MEVALRRIVCALLLGLCAVGAGASVAQAAAGLDHACCHRALADSPAAPEMPCDGFLPLTCCHATALPSSDRGASQSPAPFALPSQPTLAIAPRIAGARIAHAALAARSAPTRLTVVLQL